MPTARDHIKENEMGGSYSTHVRGKKCKTDSVRRPEEKIPLGMLTHEKIILKLILKE
jgi:hypothetical protein